MNGISALIKETSQSSSPLLPCEDTERRQLCIRKLSPDIKSAGTMTLDFPAPRTVRNKCFLFISTQLIVYLLLQPE